MKKFSVLALLTLTALLLSACASSQAAATPLTPAASAAAGRVIAEGRLEPASYLDASFSLPGQVAEVLVQDGDVVTKDQVLARLSSSPDASLALTRARQEALAAQQALDLLKTNAGLNLAQADAAVVAAARQVEKDQKLFNSSSTDESLAQLEVSKARLTLDKEAHDKLNSSNGLDPDALAAAQARLDTAQASLNAAKAALDALELKAPQDGSVVDLTLQPGQRVSAGMPILTVADTTAWVVKTDNLTEAQVVQVRSGQPVSIVLDALPDTALVGAVTRINSRYEVKRGDITYTVTTSLNQILPQMRWGMTAAITFAP